MKPGDQVQVINPENPWFESLGEVHSLVECEGEPTTRVRVFKLSQHSLQHAIGTWDSTDLKLIEEVQGG